MKNYGINWQKELADQKESDEIYGAGSVVGLVQIPLEDREKYLPIGELQNIGSEKMDCASRSPVNDIATQVTFLFENGMSVENKKWLLDNGYIGENGRPDFSDCYIAILSGTTPEGNSLIAPLQAIHEFGLIPKSMLPQISSFDEYYNPARITDAMKKLGKEFITRFPIRYQRVYEEDFSELSKKFLLGVAGYAWPSPVNGEYPRVDRQPNHAFVIYKPEYYAFDNYIANDSFMKKLASNFDFLGYGYRLYIVKEVILQGQISVKNSLFQRLWGWICGFFAV